MPRPRFHMPVGCWVTRPSPRGRSGSAPAAGGPSRSGRSLRRPAPRCPGPRSPSGRPAPAVRATRGPARSPPRRAGERFGICGAAGKPGADLDPGRRYLDRGSALETDRARLAVAGDRTAIPVVIGAQRLARRREFTLGVARTAPEERARPAGAARHQMALVAARAADLEGQRLRRRRTRFVNVRALGISIAADERAEPAALRDEVSAVLRPADRTRLADTRQRRRLGGAGSVAVGSSTRTIDGERSCLLVLRILRAAEKRTVAPQPDDHRMALGANLVARQRPELARID